MWGLQRGLKVKSVFSAASHLQLILCISGKTPEEQVFPTRRGASCGERGCATVAPCGVTNWKITSDRSRFTTVNKASPRKREQTQRKTFLL